MSTPPRDTFLHIAITDTGNAAFVEVGRANELARMLIELAESIEHTFEDARHLSSINRPLMDNNGNTVGRISGGTTRPVVTTAPQTFSLVVHYPDADVVAPYDIARQLEAVATLVEADATTINVSGEGFTMVGEFTPAASLALTNGQLNMALMIAERRVHLVDDGTFGLSDENKRYAVCIGDYEVGYDRCAGEIHVVDASGQAIGGDDPEIFEVRDQELSSLSREEHDSILAVATGFKTLLDHDLMYSAPSEFSFIRPGASVCWADPDDGISSGIYQVFGISTELGYVTDSDVVIDVHPLNDPSLLIQVSASELSPFEVAPEVAPEMTL